MTGLLDRLMGRPAWETADIATERLWLRAITEPMLEAEAAEDRSLFPAALRANVTAEWPPEHWEPHVRDYIARQFAMEPDTRGWHRYVLLPGRGPRRSTLVGAVGAFPKEGGDVEIGYSTLPEFQRRGYATEAARGLVEWLFAQERVLSVSAQTYPHMAESVKVMERCGMLFAGDGDDAGTIRYRRLR